MLRIIHSGGGVVEFTLHVNSWAFFDKELIGCITGINFVQIMLNGSFSCNKKLRKIEKLAF